MARLYGTTLLALRNNPKITKIPPFLSLFCVAVGIVWLLLLPLDGYSRRTYISENALLPGQVHTYFAGSEQNVFRAYKHEVDSVADKETVVVVDKLAEIFSSAGLRVARQKFEYVSSRQKTAGENIYSILHAPRGDATEAIVLAAPWINAEGEVNRSGVALLLTLARYFKRWSLWSKDIIFLITSDSWAGPQAWVDAYHDTHWSYNVSSLPLKSGALQGAVILDYPFSRRFESIHIVYDGINGQLPNLDLVNTAAAIAGSQMGIGMSIQQMWKHDDKYKDRLRTMLRGMFSQALGQASGPHSCFVPYHVDAITLQAVGDGWQDEMAMGRTIESIFRSLNNLLEHFHQSFFFYLLMHPKRFVSIGTYLPSAMLIAGNFTIMAIALWIQSGRPSSRSSRSSSNEEAKGNVSKQLANKGAVQVIQHGDDKTILLPSTLAVAERKMFLPLALVIGFHVLGLLRMWLFVSLPASKLSEMYTIPILFSEINILLCIAAILEWISIPTTQQCELIKSFSLLVLGMFVSTLATLNFSLALIIGLLSTPLTFAPATSSIGDIEEDRDHDHAQDQDHKEKIHMHDTPPSPLPPASTRPPPLPQRRMSRAQRIRFVLRWMIVTGSITALSPHLMLDYITGFDGATKAAFLTKVVFGWHVWRAWTPLVAFCCVWWSAWAVGMLLCMCQVRTMRQMIRGRI